MQYFFKKSYSFLLILLISAVISGLVSCDKKNDDPHFVTFTATPQSIQMFYKDESGKNYGSLKNLKYKLGRSNKELIFAMNGGMYKKDHSPQGLYIEKGKLYQSLDSLNGNGNFYLKPNGVFYITDDNKAYIRSTSNLLSGNNIRYATQSGPMLIIDGKMHHAFKKGSSNVQIRNGVGVLPDGNIIFAMSKEPINFYDFAQYFKSQGCKDALYLDGFVSRTYLPSKNWTQNDGDFGVIIGVTQ
jgi:uncharacterized protein YigE (DUF2233 family)